VSDGAAGVIADSRPTCLPATCGNGVLDPSPRHHHAVTYDVARVTAIAFGGDDGTPLGLRDTGLLRCDDPSVPVEACQAAIDSDGDGFAGCEDPDCAGFCARCGDGVCDGAETSQLCPSDCELLSRP
jgi:hypothetical protein